MDSSSAIRPVHVGNTSGQVADPPHLQVMSPTIQGGKDPPKIQAMAIEDGKGEQYISPLKDEEENPKKQPRTEYYSIIRYNFNLFVCTISDT